MKPGTQISAHISADTKARLERYVRNTGITRGYLVEQALLHHLQALEDLPSGCIVPVQVVLTEKSARQVLDLVNQPPEPSAALRRLFPDR